uniref:Uncharacterized protein n=1 Tax=Parascaris univalens TaxID=6257 RepID=A0A915A4H4_PARUN
MTTPQVKCENKDAEGVKVEKGNVTLLDQGTETKKIEETSRHRKLFLEYGQQLRHIYILRSMGALIIMLGATMVFASALLFYRQAHCGDEWSQWSPCKDSTDVSTRHRCGVVETAPCRCPEGCADIGSGIRTISQFPKIYCSKETVYDVTGEHFIRFDEQPKAIAMRACKR